MGILDLPARGTGPQGPPGLVWRGTWSSSNTYALADAVTYAGSAYIAVAASTGVTPGMDASRWSLLASKGDAGPSGSGAAGQIGPANMNMLGWTFDPLMFRGDNYQTAAGQLYGTLVNLPAGTITGVTFGVWSAGSGLTSGQNFIALINASSGARVAVTNDLTSAFGAAGMQRVSFTSSVSFAGGDCYAVFLCNGTTLPYFVTAYAGDTTMMNTYGTASKIRTGQISNGFGLTSVPASVDVSTSLAGNRAYFAGVY